MTDRKDRRVMLDSIVEIIQKERGVSWPATSDLTAECEDALERCLFDHDAALAVLRGEQELEDDPWSNCPICDCDTYFRMRLALERTTQLATPLTVFVCEGCQHVEMRGRSTVEVGEWWTAGTRLRARAEPAHPYRGNAVDDDDDDDDDDDENEDAPDDAVATAEPVEWNERRVCFDGACIGIIGANGRCSVCGRSEDGASA